MVELAIARQLVSCLITKLLFEPAFTYLKEQVQLQSNLSLKLENLRNRLLSVEPVLSIAERKLANNYRLPELLRKLEDAVYDAEDLLDEFALRDSQQQQAENDGGGKRACPSCFYSCFVVTRRVISGDKSVVPMIDAIREKLESISEDIVRLLDLLNLDATSHQDMDEDEDGGKATWRMQTSFVVEEMLGRDEEKSFIKSMLLRSSDDDDDDHLFVLPIVGIGGVGKTTLARSVYNDDDVKKSFQLRIWVCVPDDFNVFRLTKEITERVTGEAVTHNLNLDDLQAKLQNAVMSKRFLLVLDDVWKRGNQNLQRKWDLLRAPLIISSESEGPDAQEVIGMSTSARKESSKIIITTRDEEVARIMGTTIEHVRLSTLSNDIFLRFFLSCAFKGANPDDYPVLKEMGEEIAKKLGGSPLAAKTVGALLNSNPDEEHWSNILLSELWQLPLKEDGIIPALKVSYINLPPHLKQCFSYCAIFPKDYVFQRDYLVLHWLAHGYIQSQSMARRVEAIGKEYLDDLACRSFFERTGEDGTYVMHDLIHELAGSIAADHCFRIEDQKHMLRSMPQTVRHLSICTDDDIDISQLERLCDLKKLRTLVFFCGYMPEMFAKLEKVRVLDLSGYPSEGFVRSSVSPDEAIAGLKHLRYLNLSAISFTKLPEPMCNLHHLQVLYLGMDCKSLPEGFSNLINLRHLMGRSETISMIACIHRLKYLQELQSFKVLNKRGHELSELKDLNQLRGSLMMENLENAADKKKAEEANMLQKRNLIDLKLIWSEHRDDENNGRASDDVIEGLQPSPSLKKLEIWGHNGLKPPSWMKMQMLPKLEGLSLSFCERWEVLPPLGLLRSLKCLDLLGMQAIRSIGGHGFYGADAHGTMLPSLESLTFSGMAALEEWLGAEGCQLFPRLRRLYITHCPKLKMLPLLPPKLEHLQLFEVGLLCIPSSSMPLENNGGMPEDSSSGSSKQQPQGHTSLLSSLEVRHCPWMTSLPEQVLGCMTALKDLHLESCMELTTLGGLQALVSLHRLEIIDCRKLAGHWMEEDGPPSLSNLCIDNPRLITTGFLRRSLGCIQVFELTRCAALTQFSPEENESLKCLKAVRTFSIAYCDRLQALPEELQSLSSLRKLSIKECPEISSLPSKGLPLGLEEFHASSCHPELRRRCHRGKGADWHKIQLIPKLSIES